MKAINKNIQSYLYSFRTFFFHGQGFGKNLFLPWSRFWKKTEDIFTDAATCSIGTTSTWSVQHP